MHNPWTDNTYMTPVSEPSRLARLMPGLAFHARMLSIYVSAYRLAVKGMYPKEQWAKSSLRVMRCLESVGVRFVIENLDVLRKLTPPCVIIGNHMSTMETFVLPGIIQPFMDLTFVVKDSLLRYPVFNEVLKTRDPVIVGRTDPRHDLRSVMVEGRKRLQGGTSVMVFPQTTRSTEFNPERFNTIGVKLARLAEVQVVPLALKTDAWDTGRIIKDLGPIHIDRPVRFAFGEPMTIAGSGHEQHNRVAAFIAEKLRIWDEGVKPFEA